LSVGIEGPNYIGITWYHGAAPVVKRYRFVEHVTGMLTIGTKI